MTEDRSPAEKEAARKRPILPYSSRCVTFDNRRRSSLHARSKGGPLPRVGSRSFPYSAHCLARKVRHTLMTCEACSSRYEKVRAAYNDRLTLNSSGLDRGGGRNIAGISKSEDDNDDGDDQHSRQSLPSSMPKVAASTRRLACPFSFHEVSRQCPNRQGYPGINKLKYAKEVFPSGRIHG